MVRTTMARVACVLALAATGLTMGSPAGAAPPVTPSIDPGLLAAMGGDLGLTPEQALDRLAKESDATEAEEQLRDRLGPAFGGAYFDHGTSRLVVGVTDGARTPEIVATGAWPRPVAHSQSQLDAAKDALDSASPPADVHSWYVDVLSNSVVVEAARRDAATVAFADRAKATGVPVRTEHTPRPRPVFDLRGGDAWQGPTVRCSVGFNATTKSGDKAFLTAGHCTKGGGAVRGGNQAPLGTMSGSTFSAAGDYGKVSVTNPAWTLPGAVNRHNGTNITVSGAKPAAVNASICRSGATTKWRCGTVGAKNVTVNYPGGPTVKGLTRTTACAEPGDSGGPFLSGRQAQGMTSGSSGTCAAGGMTFFQPVKEALSAYGLRLVTG
jgi:streptogrisin C